MTYLGVKKYKSWLHESAKNTLTLSRVTLVNAHVFRLPIHWMSISASQLTHLELNHLQHRIFKKKKKELNCFETCMYVPENGYREIWRLGKVVLALAPDLHKGTWRNSGHVLSKKQNLQAHNKQQ